jgi:hypothetical protein
MIKNSRAANTTRSVLATVVALWLAEMAQAGYHDTSDTVTISNVKATPRDDKTATLSFDLSWGRSFRHEFNHDAVWVVPGSSPDSFPHSNRMPRAIIAAFSSG